MPATATQVFDFIEGHPSFPTERHEISLAAFGALRRSLRTIVVNLREGGDYEAADVADRLRSLLSEWLTVPVPFDGSMLAALQAFGDPAGVEVRWGRDIRIAFDTALSAAQSLQLVENPVRTRLQAVIRELRASGRSFRIYCHRTARPHFDSLFVGPSETPLPDAAFLHSPPDYREAETFDTLIKIGPLRSWGWGSAPDAIKAAPRFATLVQIVWAGCEDEPGFGYDPVAPVAGDTTPTLGPVTDDGALGNRISWTPRITRFGDGGAASGGAPEEDEFQVFGRLNQPGQKRRATLVQIDGEHGILFAPHSQVISFDPAPDARNPVSRRLPGETLIEGMFVIRPLLGDVDLGNQQAGHGQYSRIWKARLSEERRNDPAGLVARLRAAGLDLACLPADIRNWCVAPTTVIHAPHKRKHFEILIRVLLPDSDSDGAPGRNGIPWWHSAWNEIRATRGDAIQAGRHGQELVDDELLVVLGGLLPLIRQKASQADGFSLPLPTGQTLRGAALFNRVSLVEDGFLAPDAELRVVRELNILEQWRA
jgi:hypothetical protein